jgi:toxin ParE1/3/4
MPKYIITDEAEDDIDEILAYIAEDNFEAALDVYSRFLEVFKMLANNPNAGRLRTELNETWRSFPVGNYLIFYRLWARDVSITRVLHSARELDEIIN